MVKNLPANAGDVGPITGLRRSPGKRNGDTPVFLPEKSHRPRILEGYSPWGCKELKMMEQLNNNHLERRVVLFSFDVMSVVDVKEFNLKTLLVNFNYPVFLTE